MRHHARSQGLEMLTTYAECVGRGFYKGYTAVEASIMLLARLKGRLDWIKNPISLHLGVIDTRLFLFLT